MAKLQAVCGFLNEFAPRKLAADWDNVGLLVGDRQREVNKIMTCLTITPDSAGEAADEGVDLIVSHHPLPFRSLKRLTTDNTAGRLLLQLIESKVAIFSPHTAFDSAAAGINQRLAEAIGLTEIAPLESPDEDDPKVGTGRVGKFSTETNLQSVADQLKTFLKIDGMHIVGSANQTIRKAAIGCGSAGQFIDDAIRLGCDLLVTGETNFHTCLEAEANSIGLLLPGHYASERFAVEALADVLDGEFSDATVWASRRESDPLRWYDS